MKQMRPSINVMCGRAVKELVLTGKELFTAKDIAIALTRVGRGSKSSKRDYMGNTGYLETRGFLDRVVGGCILPDSSNGMIVVKVMPGNETLTAEVYAVIGDALNGFKGVTEVRMEV